MAIAAQVSALGLFFAIPSYWALGPHPSRKSLGGGAPRPECDARGNRGARPAQALRNWLVRVCIVRSEQSSSECIRGGPSLRCEHRPFHGARPGLRCFHVALGLRHVARSRLQRRRRAVRRGLPARNVCGQLRMQHGGQLLVLDARSDRRHALADWRPDPRAPAGRVARHHGLRHHVDFDPDRNARLLDAHAQGRVRPGPVHVGVVQRHDPRKRPLFCHLRPGCEPTCTIDGVMDPPASLAATCTWTAQLK